MIVADFRLNIKTLTLNDFHAANIRLLFFISKHSCLKVQAYLKKYNLKWLYFQIKVIKDIYSRFSSALPAPVPLYLLRVVLNL